MTNPKQAHSFIEYLDIIEKLVKEGKHDEAWGIANRGVIELADRNEELWYMMYYQMALILAKERKWKNTLEKMSCVIFYGRGLGGQTHRHFVERLLKRLHKPEVLDEYIKISLNNPPEAVGEKIHELLGRGSKSA